MTSRRFAPPVLDDRTLSLIDSAVAEDVRGGDITSNALVPATLRGTGTIRAKARGVLAGIPVVATIIRRHGPEIALHPLIADGDAVAPGSVVARLEGPARSLLRLERVLLNYLQRLSGIATLARQYVDAVAGTDAVILDTRKTAPGHRELDKYAVRAGGAVNHRLALDDQILVKENHLRLSGLDVAGAVARCRALGVGTVEIEVETLAEFDAAVAAGADIVMLDDMSDADIREAVRRRGATRIPAIEVSGGMTPERAAAVACLGVDRISVGRLTHSAPALDIALKIAAP